MDYKQDIPSFPQGMENQKNTLFHNIFMLVRNNLFKLSTEFSTPCGKLLSPQTGLFVISTGISADKLRQMNDKSTTFLHFSIVIPTKYRHFPSIQDVFIPF
ncbi:MAG: hypothetical protein IJX72_00295 [Clostridia bacterium]|nr:hypothetical protein [Clostridia bacterium]